MCCARNCLQISVIVKKGRTNEWQEKQGNQRKQKRENGQRKHKKKDDSMITGQIIQTTGLTF
jgi:hypothetical protein